MKFNFKWGDNNRQEMTPELVQYKVNTYTHPNVIKGAEHLGMKQCKVCGEWFAPKRVNQVCCGAECSEKNKRITRDEWNAKRREKRVRQLSSGTARRSVTFLPTVGYGKPVVRRNGRTWTPPIKPCKVCGKEFSAVTGRQVYCSSECARAGQCQSSAAYYARKKRQQATKTQTVATPAAKTDASTVPATTHAVPVGNVKAQDFWTKQANTITKLIKAGMDEEFVAEYLQMVFGNK